MDEKIFEIGYRDIVELAGTSELAELLRRELNSCLHKNRTVYVCAQPGWLQFVTLDCDDHERMNRVETKAFWEDQEFYQRPPEPEEPKMPAILFPLAKRRDDG